MEFSRQEYWSGLPFSTPGDLPDPRIKPTSPVSPALAGRFFTTGPPGKPIFANIHVNFIRFNLTFNLNHCQMSRPPAPSLSWAGDLTFYLMKAISCPVAQLCLTACKPMDSMDCSLPGSPIHGILQGRILKCVAISFSRRSSWCRDGAQVSWIIGRFFTLWATREVNNQNSGNSLSSTTSFHFYNRGITIFSHLKCNFITFNFLRGLSIILSVIPFSNIFSTLLFYLILSSKDQHSQICPIEIKDIICSLSPSS